MMRFDYIWNKWQVIVMGGCLLAMQAEAQSPAGESSPAYPSVALGWLLALLIGVLIAAVILSMKVKDIAALGREERTKDASRNFTSFIEGMDSREIDRILASRQRLKQTSANTKKPYWDKVLVAFSILLISILYPGNPGLAQSTAGTKKLMSEGGVIITITLILIPILAGIVLLIVRASKLLRYNRNQHDLKDAEQFAAYMVTLTEAEVEATLVRRKAALEYNLTHEELAGKQEPTDHRGVIGSINANGHLPFVSPKKKALKRPKIDPGLAKLVLWYFGSAAFWLVFGTSVGEYLGIKFVAPDVDQVSWLSFGRLRPVHTNAVFWGWASLGMLGLGYYIIPTVCNAPLASLKKGWYTLWLINAAVISGSILLMAGINNGGGEYREYIWPVMLLFGLGLILTLVNFLRTIARRMTKEIYISNWYIVSAIMFALTITVVAYVPSWQNGLGETIIQGYYMHQGVGMWFMLFTLGIVYYLLPQQLNKPIYSYSLGILAFWSQILFYTLIGTHHFVFSSIPWWLQTVAIVGSVGMVIPVVAGTTNFIMTFKGVWSKVETSYTLPFFLAGIIFYFTGSLQGTAEAFRSTNLIWHFTDFTVAHSHLTMYGIICFFLWAGMYAVIPRLTGKEAPQITIGAHFWLALIGLMFYTVPLMIGSTLRGQMWIEGKPFIESVVHMAPYWLWRAIGGSLMWLSHLFFAFNLYQMIRKNNTVNVRAVALDKLEQQSLALHPIV